MVSGKSVSEFGHKWDNKDCLAGSERRLIYCLPNRGYFDASTETLKQGMVESRAWPFLPSKAGLSCIGLSDP